MYLHQIASLLFRRFCLPNKQNIDQALPQPRRSPEASLQSEAVWNTDNCDREFDRHFETKVSQSSVYPSGIHVFFSSRFPILRSGIRTKIHNAVKIVVGAVCIHNYIINIGEPDPDWPMEEEEEDPNPDQDLPNVNDAAARVQGEIYRDWLMERTT